MIRYALLALACLAPAGCLNWQAAYDNAARRDCTAIVDATDRQDCLTSVERNASDRRAGQHI